MNSTYLQCGYVSRRLLADNIYVPEAAPPELLPNFKVLYTPPLACRTITAAIFLSFRLGTRVVDWLGGSCQLHVSRLELHLRTLVYPADDTETSAAKGIEAIIEIYRAARLTERPMHKYEARCSMVPGSRQTQQSYTNRYSRPSLYSTAYAYIYLQLSAL